MTEDVFKMLDKEVHTPEIDKLLKRCNDLVNQSRACMQKRYDVWDYANQTYLGEMVEDGEDKKARDKKEPVKMVVPLTFAQVQSFASFVYLLLTQNRTFFEMKGTGGEDYAHDAEGVLERDLRHNKWPLLLYQCAIDVPRFGMCVTEACWKEDYVNVPVQTQQPATSFMGIEFKKGKLVWETTKVLKYKGNEVRVISPYNFFPDHRLPLRDLQMGEFVAYDDEMGENQLKAMQQDKTVAGIDHIRPLQASYMQENKMRPRFGAYIPEGTGAQKHTAGIKFITKVQIDIIPKDLDIGKEEFPIRYLVWIANCNRIIRLEPMGYLHNQFTLNVGEYMPDEHAEGKGLAGMIEYLQDTVTWLINSHIASIRKTIDSKFIYDPAGIDTKSLESRSPYIALKKNVSRSGVDRWIKQFQVVDATGNHMMDAEGVNKIIQMITGINDNAQGQYNSGRRSATESRAVTAGAAGRLRMHNGLLWWGCFDPMGQQMLANSRQGMDEELWIRIFGQPPQDPMDAQKYMERMLLFKGDPQTIAQMDDFMTYDGTLPSEKGFIAQSLQELIAVAMSNPETAFALNLNLSRMIEETARLRGIDNIEKFRNTQEEQLQQYARLRAITATSAPTPGPGTSADQGNTQQ